MSDSMRAARFDAATSTLSVQDVPVPEPGPNDVLVRVMACGICLSDVHLIDGSLPGPLPVVTPGHESAGVVEQVGSEVRTVKVGDHVVTCLSAFCGHCEYCVTGRMSLCPGGDTRRPKGAPPRITGEDGSAIAQMLNLSGFA